MIFILPSRLVLESAVKRQRRGAWMALLLTMALVPAAAEEGALPVWSVGDRWTFDKFDGPTYDNQGVIRSTIVFLIKESRDRSYGVEVTTQPARTDRGPVLWNISRGLNTYWRDGAQLPWTELRFLNWPLGEGTTWQFQHPQRDGGLFSWRASAERWEEVVVPAGRFKALLIVIDGRSADGSYAKHGKLWYAPAVKWKVKEEWVGEPAGHATYVARERWELHSYELH
jgi:hypothetical protein